MSLLNNIGGRVTPGQGVTSADPWNTGKSFDIAASGHFKVLPVRSPRDADFNETIQATGAQLGGGFSRSPQADYNEMDWYRRNVYLKKGQK